MATSKSLPSLVHFVRGFAAWAFLVFVGQGPVLCPTKETANESHHHGARS